MVNGSFVFGMDDDDPTVFERTVEWAIEQGIETATFHILTPYPGTGLHTRMAGRGPDDSPRLGPYDTRHVVYRPAQLTPEELEAGYWRAYRDFYRWGSIFRGASTKERWSDRLRHVAYAGGWKKLEPMWDVLIRAKRATSMLPVLEAVLSGFGRYPAPGWVEGGDDGDEGANADQDCACYRSGERSPYPLAPGSPPCAGEGSNLPLPLGRGAKGPHGRCDEGRGEGLSSAPLRAEEGSSPRFIPLAVAIDLGMTPPIGSIMTTEVEVRPFSPGRPPRPTRRHLRLLPNP